MGFSEYLTEAGNSMKVFKETDDLITYSSPGPMKVTGNMINSIYRSKGNIRIPTDEAIDMSLKTKPSDFKNMVWFEPGGYALWMTHYKGPGTSVIFGRPNNAQGSSIILEVDNSGRKWFDKKAKHFNNINNIRKYLKPFHGKPIVWLNSKNRDKIKSGDIKGL